MAVVDDITYDIRFGMGDLIVTGSDPRYSPTMITRRIDNALALFNKHNSLSYTIEGLPAEYQDFISILVQILLCRWEAARNARKFKIILNNLNASINERVEQYLSVADSLVADYNRLALMTDGEVSTIQSSEEEVEKPLPDIDNYQGILTLFDEDSIKEINSEKSIFTSNNSFPNADNTTVITLTFTPRDIMSNNLGHGLDIDINGGTTTFAGSFIGDVVDNNDGTYSRNYKVSNTSERITFFAYLNGQIISNLKVNVG